MVPSILDLVYNIASSRTFIIEFGVGRKKKLDFPVIFIKVRVFSYLRYVYMVRWLRLEPVKKW